MFIFLSSYNLPEPILSGEFLQIPIVTQAADYSCGAAALLSILLYWKIENVYEMDLHEQLKISKKKGVDPTKIVEVVKEEYELLSFYKENLTIDDLKQSIVDGYSVILAIQAWPDGKDKNKKWSDMWNSGHYVVLVGIDANYIYVMDPSVSGAYAFIPIPEFLERWHDYEEYKNKSIWKYYNLGIFIKGETHIEKFPGSLKKVN
jgi:predicted double-glycine peptidase